MAMREKTKKLTVSAMLAALGVVLLYLGSLVDVLDISMAAVVSLCAVFAVIEYGGAWPWLIYLVTGLLSLLLLPNRSPAVLYLLFFGYYPILKEKLERRSRVVSWVLKELVFQLALALMLAIGHFFLNMSEGAEPLYYYASFALIAEIAFPVYDIALTRLITLYLVQLRKRLRLK